MTLIEIRPGRADEIESIYATHRDSVHALCAGYYSDEQIARWLDDRSPAMYLPAIAAGRLWVAAAGDAITGFVEIAGHEVTKLFVGGAHAGGGVGRRLLACAVDAIRDTGAAAVYLEATRNARDFYARHGFVEIGVSEFGLGASGIALEVVKMERALR